MSAGFHSLWNILTQSSKNSHIFSGIKGAWLVIFAVVFFSMEGLPPRELWVWGIVSAFLHAFYIYCLSSAYSTLDISYVYPIARSAPALVPVFAFVFLGERIGWPSIVGIAIILVAIYTLHFDGHLINGFRRLYDALLHEDFRWAFLTLFMVVFYSLWDKKAMDIFFQIAPKSVLLNGISFFFMEAGICFILYGLYLPKKFLKEEIIDRFKKEWIKGFIGAIATIGSYGLICVVFQFEAVSEVVALRQTSVLMVVFWGCFKLGEPFGKQRILSAGMILAGVGLVGWNGR
tara:strand:+ start:4350 stop:5216 length:867 start_codon:yes stop_codon:yes gene_type:complete